MALNIAYYKVRFFCFIVYAFSSGSHEGRKTSHGQHYSYSRDNFSFFIDFSFLFLQPPITVHLFHSPYVPFSDSLRRKRDSWEIQLSLRLFGNIPNPLSLKISSCDTFFLYLFAGKVKIKKRQICNAYECCVMVLGFC